MENRELIIKIFQFYPIYLTKTIWNFEIIDEWRIEVEIMIPSVIPLYPGEFPGEIALKNNKNNNKRDIFSCIAGREDQIRKGWRWS